MKTSSLDSWVMYSVRLAAFGALAWSSASFALPAQAPEFSLSAALRAKTLVITSTPPKAHHFNVQAPMSAQAEWATGKSLSPRSRSEKKVTFELPSPKTGLVTVSLYLCDDKLTFCEKKTMALDWKGVSTSAGPAPETSTQTASAESPKKTASASRAHGFILNDPDAAFAQAKKEGKPLMIDFFAIWCPPCNQLDEKVFSSAEFRKQSARFVRLKIDVDQKTSWNLVSRYKISGYPTIVFASSDGDEISRVVGFRPKKEFLLTLGEAFRDRGEPFAVLQAKAEKGDLGAAERLGAIQLERGEYEAAIRLLEKASASSKSAAEKSIDAQAGLWSAKKKDGASDAATKLASILEKGVALFPDSPASVSRRMDLAEMREEHGEKDRAQALYRDAISFAKKAIERPSSLRAYDVSEADLWVEIAEAHEKLGEKTASTAAYKAAAKSVKKRMSSPHERGYGLDLAYCLWKSGDVPGAERIYRDLESRYPEEFTFFFNHASMNFRLSRLDQAKPLAQEALDHSYGSNRLDSALLYAKIAHAQKNDGEAKAVLKLVKKTDERIPDDQMVRYARGLKRIADFEKTLD